MLTISTAFVDFMLCFSPSLSSLIITFKAFFPRQQNKVLPPENYTNDRLLCRLDEAYICIKHYAIVIDTEKEVKSVLRIIENCHSSEILH